MASRVTAIEPVDAEVTLLVAGERVRGPALVVATGPWIGELVPALARLATPIRQVVAWYDPKDRAATALGTLPVFLRDAGPVGSFFGFRRSTGWG